MLVKAMKILLLGLTTTSSISTIPAAQAEFFPIGESQPPCPECSPSSHNGIVHTRNTSTTEVTLATRDIIKDFFPASGVHFFTKQGAIAEGPRDSEAGYSATIADCEALRSELYGINGYWMISNFTFAPDGYPEMEKEFYTVGSCSVWLRAWLHAYPLQVGNGDIIAWISASIDSYNVGGTTGSSGNMSYGITEYGWLIK